MTPPRVQRLARRVARVTELDAQRHDLRRVASVADALAENRRLGVDLEVQVAELEMSLVPLLVRADRVARRGAVR